jgi:hypothetical protein
VPAKWNPHALGFIRQSEVCVSFDGVAHFDEIHTSSHELVNSIPGFGRRADGSHHRRQLEREWPLKNRSRRNYP